MTDRVDASVHRVQASLSHATEHRVAIETALSQLARRYLAFLLCRPECDENVRGCLVLIAPSATRTRHPFGHEGIVASVLLRNQTCLRQLCAS